MLDHLFGSRARVKLLQIFLNNPQQHYYLRELTRKLNLQLTAVRREVTNLEKIGILVSIDVPDEEDDEDKKVAKSKKPTKGKKSTKTKKKPTTKKHYMINREFLLFPELKGLFIKAQLLLEQDFVKKVESLSRLKLFVLTGVFVDNEDAGTDMLLVGTVNRRKLKMIVEKFEKDVDREINYTVMTPQEFNYRKEITDRFLYTILGGKKVVVVDAG